MDKIICLGKNYLAHARELGDAVPAKPVLFLKPPSVLIEAPTRGARVQAPLDESRGEIHHEVELVLRIRGRAYRVDPKVALHSVDAFTLGLDMTARDVQKQLKRDGHPWEIAKVFPGSAILGPWVEFGDPESLKHLEFSFHLDGDLRQSGNTDDMGLDPAGCIAWASHHFELNQGDVVFTGTPEGVGPVNVGQRGLVQLGKETLFEVEWISSDEDSGLRTPDPTSRE